MINRVVLVGRLVADPELKVTQSNISIVNFRLAVGRPFSNAQGEKETDFINVIAFRKQAESISQYMKKGSQIAIDGRIQTRNYENREGQRVYVTEVIAERAQFLDSKGDNSSRVETPMSNVSGAGRYQSANLMGNQGGLSQGNRGGYGQGDINDDDLPF